MIRTVADLRRALEAYPDDMPALFYVETDEDTNLCMVGGVGQLFDGIPLISFAPVNDRGPDHD